MGLIRLILQKAIGSPKGIATSKVTANINNDILNPSNKNTVTFQKDICVNIDNDRKRDRIIYGR